MLQEGITVIITTYNRSNLVKRAIESVLQQKWKNLEIIVVDDASDDDTKEVVRIRYPFVKYICQENNLGPGPARNRGLYECSHSWALILDDDDALIPDALKTINSAIIAFKDKQKYPVFNFAHSNGKLSESFLIVSAKNYLNGTLRGDFVPVINVPLFRKNCLAYPDLRIGGEHLLWWTIGEKYGIPSWDLKVAQVFDDAPMRLTSFYGQMNRAREHAELQDITLALFNDLLLRIAPEKAIDKYLGSAAYWLMAGERRLCRKRLKSVIRGARCSQIVYAIILWLLSWLPLSFARAAFIRFRKRSLKNS